MRLLRKGMRKIGGDIRHPSPWYDVSDIILTKTIPHVCKGALEAGIMSNYFRKTLQNPLGFNYLILVKEKHGLRHQIFLCISGSNPRVQAKTPQNEHAGVIIRCGSP